jgi:hypothetical protein
VIYTLFWGLLTARDSLFPKNSIFKLKTMRIFFIILGALCVISAAVMYSFKDDSHLSELGDYWWVPLPLSVASIIVAARSRS